MEIIKTENKLMYLHLFFHPLQDKLTQIYRYFLHFSLTTQALVLARSSLDLSNIMWLRSTSSLKRGFKS